ncbi:hypothetical protein [Hyperthermus butylicus]|uniref:Uncharacterized protein n=1 Tax=Hyperthermus butylicus (strain DSM 5456 / JCM 9403 / PLM1-5) TaxID=415426 RepID=A2BM63_HYPBU|nr:hypothetical protein [Hyperthermus butylicus]ABM81074.1 hypothetical protein Hbut_1242 [Hyperthermus butylicus DSM 5456]
MQSIVDSLGVELRAYLSPPLQRLAVVLAAVAANNIARGLAITPTILCSEAFTEAILGALTANNAEQVNVRDCGSSMAIGTSTIVLWCEPPAWDVVVFYAGPLKPPPRRLARLKARHLASDTYLLETSIAGRRLREYVRLKGYQLIKASDPCPRDIIELLCEHATAGRIALRDAVDVIAYNKNVRRGEARRIIQELASMDCLRLDSLGYIVIDYCRN